MPIVIEVVPIGSISVGKDSSGISLLGEDYFYCLLLGIALHLTLGLSVQGYSKL